MFLVMIDLLVLVLVNKGVLIKSPGRPVVTGALRHICDSSSELVGGRTGSATNCALHTASTCISMDCVGQAILSINWKYNFPLYFTAFGGDKSYV